LSQALTGTLIGVCTMLPDSTPRESLTDPIAVAPDPFGPLDPPLSQVLLPSLFSKPPRMAWLPQALIGTFTGAWMMLPDRMPPEWLVDAVAFAPPDDPEPEPFASGAPVVEQAPPTTLLAIPTTMPWLPHTFSGMSTGTWTVFPEPMPPE
jgi:hypothetical protein